MDHWLAPEWGDVFMRYDPEALRTLIEDDDQTSTRIQNEVKATLRSIEEGREALDLPAEFEADDTLLVPTTAQIVPAKVAVEGMVPGLNPGTTEPQPGQLGTPAPQGLLPAGTDTAGPVTGGEEGGGKGLGGRDLEATANKDPNNPTKQVNPTQP